MSYIVRRRLVLYWNIASMKRQRKECTKKIAMKASNIDVPVGLPGMYITVLS